MDWPATVGGYAVRPVEAMVPALGQVTALIVDEEADLVDEDLPEWVPAEWLSPVMGDSGVSDVYGAIGVWPAAFVAAEVIRSTSWPRPWPELRCLELGCGAGFPSLVAARLGATVYALDTEQLTLDLLQAAFERQERPVSARLKPLLGDARDVPQELLSSVDLIIVSDLLYSVALGESLGQCLGRWAEPGRHLILTDGGRSGREAFLKAFSQAQGLEAHFEVVSVPSWAPQTGDYFDGTTTTAVGLLRY